MTEQSELWAGRAGDAYHVRNMPEDRSELWESILGSRIAGIKSVFEPGAGIGDNLIAIRKMADNSKSYCRVTGMDVNQSACRRMEKRGIVSICGAFPESPIDNVYDLVVTRGFLIHLPLPELKLALDKIYDLSRRYFVLAEYYSPRRRMISYRGNRNAMWTGDYAGMLMGRHKDVRLIDYGFEYYADGGHDETWFLMEKI